MQSDRLSSLLNLLQPPPLPQSCPLNPGTTTTTTTRARLWQHHPWSRPERIPGPPPWKLPRMPRYGLIRPLAARPPGCGLLLPARPGLASPLGLLGHHHRQLRFKSKSPKRWESTASSSTTTTASTGADDTGHIAAAPNESILFFDNLFPLRLSSLMIWRPFQADDDIPGLFRKFEKSSLGSPDPIGLVKRALDAQDGHLPITVTEVIPRLKDGGAYVKFTHPSDTTASHLAAKLADALRANPIRPWFNPFRSIRAGLVKGVPWYLPPSETALSTQLTGF